jgi:hypothetical protein
MMAIIVMCGMYKREDDIMIRNVCNSTFSQGTAYNKKIDRSTEITFSSTIQGVCDNAKSEAIENNSYVNKKDSLIYNQQIYSKAGIFAELNFPIETERYSIEFNSELEGVPAYIIKDKETGKGLYIREDNLAIQKDEKTGMEFIINMDQPFSENVLVTSELKSIMNKVADKRNFDMKEIPMQGGLVVNQDIKTGLRFLSIAGNEAKGVSVIITSEQDVELINRLTDEFTQYSICSSRSIANLYALFEISGNLKRGEEGFTFLTSNGITYVPYDGNPEKAWKIEMSNQYYAAVRERLANGINFDSSDWWLELLDKSNLSNGFYEVWERFDLNSENCCQYKK